MSWYISDSARTQTPNRVGPGADRRDMPASLLRRLKLLAARFEPAGDDDVRFLVRAVDAFHVQDCQFLVCEWNLSIVDRVAIEAEIAARRNALWFIPWRHFDRPA